MYDVAVVGAGPAGSATALRVLQQLPAARVLLLDAASFPRDKTCGDGIAAHVIDELVGLGVPSSAWASADVPGLRLSTPSGRAVEQVCARSNRVIRRTDFDAALVGAAVARGAILVRHRLRRIDIRSDSVVLDGEIAARVVVGADGANSTVRRLLGAPAGRSSTVAVAIRGYAPAAADPSSLVIAFGRSRVPAYAWSFPLADGGANVGYGVLDRRAGGSRADLLEGLRRTLPGHEPVASTVRGHQLPLSTGARFHPNGRVLLTGDAAAMVNPLTGEGIYYAIVTGAMAADSAVFGAGAGAAHHAAVQQHFCRHHRHVGVLSRLVRSPRLLDAAINASARHRSVFDAAVELGLGNGTAPAGALARIAVGYVTGR
ncbi:MAG: geranylgeranyl reductase family protein [Geodermatophilaceae bacterium]|nr:geranylgeranyl reductase family protein [Geodermatophilaceae bacterium]